MDKRLDRVHEVHWKALSAAATLEEEIEKLHWMKSHFQSEVRPRSQDCWRLEGMREGKCCQVCFASEPTPSQYVDPDMPPSETGSEDRTPSLGELPELKAEVASFLEGSSEVSDGKSKEGPLEPSVSKFTNWVRWKVGKCNTPNWWAELLTVLGEDKTRRLAQEVRASFQLPRQMHELEHKEAPFQASLVLPCLHHWRFMPLVVTIYDSQDIREIPREKAIVYTRALQHFTEQNNPPKRNEWCLLAENIMELRREIEFCLLLMKKFLGEWTSAKKKKVVPWFPPPPTSLLLPIFLVPQMSLRHSQYRSQHQRRKLQCMLGGKKYYTHPSQC